MTTTIEDRPMNATKTYDVKSLCDEAPRIRRLVVEQRLRELLEGDPTVAQCAEISRSCRAVASLYPGPEFHTARSRRRLMYFAHFAERVATTLAFPR